MTDNRSAWQVISGGGSSVEGTLGEGEDLVWEVDWRLKSLDAWF